MGSIRCMLGVTAFCWSVGDMGCVVKLYLFIRDMEVIIPCLSMSGVP